MCTWVGDYYIRSKSWCWKTWSIDNIENHPSVDGRIWRPANRPVINSNPFFVFRKFAPIVSLLHASIILYNFYFFSSFSLVSRLLLVVPVRSVQARSVTTTTNTMAFAGLKKQINKANQVSLYVFFILYLLRLFYLCINETVTYVYIHYYFIVGLSYDNRRS